MNPFRRNARVVVLAFAAVLAMSTAACAPEVGSEAWCKKLQETPKGDWSANDAGSYAKHCLLK